MTRSLRSTIRIPGPFGGFAKQLDDSEIGPLRCKDCANVLLKPNRVVKRQGFTHMGGTGEYVTNSRTEGLMGGLVNSVEDFPSQTITITGTPTDGTFTLAYFGLETQTIDHDATSAELKVILEKIRVFAGQLNITGDGPHVCTWIGDRPTVPLIRLEDNSLTGGTSPTVTVAGTRSGTNEELVTVKVALRTTFAAGEILQWDGTNGLVGKTGNARWDLALNGKMANFQVVGLRGADYADKAFILDGSPYGHKLRMKVGGELYRIGLDAPEIYDIAVAGTGSYRTATYEWKITVCDRSEIVREHNVYPPPPGLESNASSFFAEHVCDGTGVTIKIKTPDHNLQYWTHVRVYRKETTVDETTFRLVGQFARHIPGETYSPFQENVNNDGGTREGLLFAPSASNHDYRLTIPGGITVDDDVNPMDSPASGTGAYDFAPTRNHPPRDMRYFAIYNGRGFWARDDSPYLWYTDDISTTSGGHYESLSTETADPLNGPITLLATYQDRLVISTPSSLYVLVGFIASHTNKSIANNQDLPPMGARIEPVAGSIGAAIGGTGAHLEVDQYLYYISRYGLARFDGLVCENVSWPIQSLLPLSDSTEDMKKAQLGHDPVNHIIYMFVGEDLGDDVPNGEYGRIRGTIWCYHYRQVDKESGLGQWTRFTTIGAGGGGLSSTHWQRYDGIAMRTPIGGEPRLVVGMRWAGATGNLRHAALVSENPDVFGDDDRDAVNEVDVPWFYETGSWDAGLLERLKEWYFLHVEITRTDNLVLGETGTREVTVSAGKLLGNVIAAIDTSDADTFDRYYRDGGSGWTEEATETQWPNAQYDDDSGTLVTMTTNRWAVLWFYLETDGDLVMLYGQGEFASETAAKAETPPASTPDRLTDQDILLGRMVFQKLADTATVLSVFAAMVDIGFQVDEGTQKTASRKEDRQLITIPIRRRGREVSVKFSGDSQVGSEVHGYSLDVLPMVDH